MRESKLEHWCLQMLSCAVNWGLVTKLRSLCGITLRCSRLRWATTHIRVQSFSYHLQFLAAIFAFYWPKRQKQVICPIMVAQSNVSHPNTSNNESADSVISTSPTSLSYTYCNLPYSGKISKTDVLFVSTPNYHCRNEVFIQRVGKLNATVMASAVCMYSRLNIQQ